MKRSPLKRHSEIKRKAPRSTEPLKKTRLNPRGRKYKPIPQEVREAVTERAKGLCEVTLPGCLVRLQHLHHKLSRAQGGRHVADNLAGCCMSCHGKIHANPEWAYRHGWLIRGQAAPEESANG